MSKNKQSSIQWIVGKLGDLESMFNLGIIDNIQYYEEKTKLLDQAKAMHKEESISYVKDFAKQMLENKRFVNAEIIYNETFGGNNGKTMDN